MIFKMDAVVIHQILRLAYQIQDNKSHDFQNECSGDLSDFSRLDEQEVHRTFSLRFPRLQDDTGTFMPITALPTGKQNVSTLRVRTEEGPTKGAFYGLT